MNTVQSKTVHRPYQQRIYDEFADKQHFILSVGMSGGKSKMVVDLHNHHSIKRGLIVCPEKVLPVWPEQFAIHSVYPYNVYIIEGSHDKKKRLLEAAYADERAIIVVSYDSCWREPLNGVLLKFGFDSVTLDESHNIKTPDSKRGRYCCRVGRQARYRWACSGTVMADRHTDVFGQMKFVEPEVFGASFVRFRDEFCKMGGFEGRVIIDSKNEELLAEKLDPYWAYVSQEEIDADLPDAVSYSRSCFLSHRATALYKEFSDKMIVQSDKGVLVASNTLEKALRLRELTSGFIKWRDPEDPTKHQIEVVDTSKRDLLKEVLSAIPKNEPVVIFAVSRFDIAVIHEVCNSIGRTTSELSGSYNQLEEWKSGRTSDIVAQIRSGSTGIELTRACYNIYYSLSYSLADYEQSAKRSHRTSQTRTVTRIHLVAHETIDRTVMQAIVNKRTIIDAIKEELRP